MHKTITYIFRHPLPQYHSIESLFKTIAGEIEKVAAVDNIVLPKSGASLGSMMRNWRAVKVSNSSIYHITGDVNYMALKLGSRCILTVHDVQSALQGSFLKRHIIAWLWFKLPVERVKLITVISEFSRCELVALVPRQAHKIKVIHNPVGSEFKPMLKDFNAINPTILCMGTKANKNLEAIFSSIRHLPCTLHIVGPLSEAQIKRLQTLELNYTNSVYLSREAVVEAYIQCDLLCFPSTYEGFGMPIIEAQATGRPVLTSNIGALKEVAGDSACLVDPYNTASIRAGLKRIILNADYRDQLISKGFENVQRFSLEHIATQYIDLYKELMPA